MPFRTPKHHLICIANRSALNERAAQGKLKPIQQLRFFTAMVRDQEVGCHVHLPDSNPKSGQRQRTTSLLSCAAK
jgi:hypothetical protein